MMADDRDAQVARPAGGRRALSPTSANAVPFSPSVAATGISDCEAVFCTGGVSHYGTTTSSTRIQSTGSAYLIDGAERVTANSPASMNSSTAGAIVRGALGDAISDHQDAATTTSRSGATSGTSSTAGSISGPSSGKTGDGSSRSISEAGNAEAPNAPAQSGGLRETLSLPRRVRKRKPHSRSARSSHPGGPSESLALGQPVWRELPDPSCAEYQSCLPFTATGHTPVAGSAPYSPAGAMPSSSIYEPLVPGNLAAQGLIPAAPPDSFAYTTHIAACAPVVMPARHGPSNIANGGVDRRFPRPPPDASRSYIFANEFDERGPIFRAAPPPLSPFIPANTPASSLPVAAPVPPLPIHNLTWIPTPSVRGGLPSVTCGTAPVVADGPLNGCGSHAPIGLADVSESDARFNKLDAASTSRLSLVEPTTRSSGRSSGRTSASGGSSGRASDLSDASGESSRGIASLPAITEGPEPTPRKARKKASSARKSSCPLQAPTVVHLPEGMPLLPAAMPLPQVVEKVQRFRSKLCLYYLNSSDNRGCPYGDKCTYAHGEEYLRLSAEAGDSLQREMQTRAELEAKYAQKDMLRSIRRDQMRAVVPFPAPRPVVVGAGYGSGSWSGHPGLVPPPYGVFQQQPFGCQQPFFHPPPPPPHHGYYQHTQQQPPPPLPPPMGAVEPIYLHDPRMQPPALPRQQQFRAMSGVEVPRHSVVPLYCSGDQLSPPLPSNSSNHHLMALALARMNAPLPWEPAVSIAPDKVSGLDSHTNGQPDPRVFAAPPPLPLGFDFFQDAVALATGRPAGIAPRPVAIVMADVSTAATIATNTPSPVAALLQRPASELSAAVELTTGSVAGRRVHPHAAAGHDGPAFSQSPLYGVSLPTLSSPSDVSDNDTIAGGKSSPSVTSGSISGNVPGVLPGVSLRRRSFTGTVCVPQIPTLSSLIPGRLQQQAGIMNLDASSDAAVGVVGSPAGRVYARGVSVEVDHDLCCSINGSGTAPVRGRMDSDATTLPANVRAGNTPSPTLPSRSSHRSVSPSPSRILVGTKSGSPLGGSSVGRGLGSSASAVAGNGYGIGASDEMMLTAALSQQMRMAVPLPMVMSPGAVASSDNAFSAGDEGALVAALISPSMYPRFGMPDTATSMGVRRVASLQKQLSQNQQQRADAGGNSLRELVPGYHGVGTNIRGDEGGTAGNYNEKPFWTDSEPPGEIATIAPATASGVGDSTLPSQVATCLPSTAPTDIQSPRAVESDCESNGDLDHLTTGDAGEREDGLGPLLAESAANRRRWHRSSDAGSDLASVLSSSVNDAGRLASQHLSLASVLASMSGMGFAESSDTFGASECPDQPGRVAATWKDVRLLRRAQSDRGMMPCGAPFSETAPLRVNQAAAASSADGDVDGKRRTSPLLADAYTSTDGAHCGNSTSGSTNTVIPAEGVLVAASDVAELASATPLKPPVATLAHPIVPVGVGVGAPKSGPSGFRSHQEILEQLHLPDAHTQYLQTQLLQKPLRTMVVPGTQCSGFDSSVGGAAASMSSSSSQSSASRYRRGAEPPFRSQRSRRTKATHASIQSAAVGESSLQVNSSPHRDVATGSSAASSSTSVASGGSAGASDRESGDSGTSVASAGHESGDNYRSNAGSSCPAATEGVTAWNRKAIIGVDSSDSAGTGYGVQSAAAAATDSWSRELAAARVAVHSIGSLSMQGSVSSWELAATSSVGPPSRGVSAAAGTSGGGVLSSRDHDRLGIVDGGADASSSSGCAHRPGSSSGLVSAATVGDSPSSSASADTASRSVSRSQSRMAAFFAAPQQQQQQGQGSPVLPSVVSGLLPACSPDDSLGASPPPVAGVRTQDESVQMHSTGGVRSSRSASHGDAAATASASGADAPLLPAGANSAGIAELLRLAISPRVSHATGSATATPAGLHAAPL